MIILVDEAGPDALKKTPMFYKNDVITEIFKSKAILVGSPTINRGILTGVAALLEEIKGLRFQDKKAAAFGCYGWSGESVKIISQNLASAGFQVCSFKYKAPRQITR